MSLSVCYLTRNEEKTLPRSIRSVAAVADQVVVADTHSSDGTARLAADLGARVYEYKWDEDFAAGRNFAIARATGDWVLWLNADEELAPQSVEPLRRCLADRDAFGHFVRVRNLLRADDPARFSETADLRLFRRRPDLRFVGRLHSALADDVVEAVKRDGQQVRACDVVLVRHAYLSESTESKLRFTLRLLERELHDRPGDLRYLIEYGRALLRLNDPRGHAVMAQAADQVVAERHAPAPPTSKVQVLLEYVLSATPAQPPTRLSPSEARELALRWFPASPRLLYPIAEQSFRAGETLKATELLERLVSLGRSGSYDRSHAFDPGLVGDDALINLAACYRRLGRLDEAEQCYRNLLDSRHFATHATQGLAAVRSMRPPRSS